MPAIRIIPNCPCTDFWSSMQLKILCDCYRLVDDTTIILGSYSAMHNNFAYNAKMRKECKQQKCSSRVEGSFSIFKLKQAFFGPQHRQFPIISIY